MDVLLSFLNHFHLMKHLLPLTVSARTTTVFLPLREIDDLILIPVFIHDFLCIHPFNDGNGRMSRLLTTLLLYRAGYVIGRYLSRKQNRPK